MLSCCRCVQAPSLTGAQEVRIAVSSTNTAPLHSLSLVQFLALHLMAHNPHTRPLLRARRKKALAAFLENAEAGAEARRRRDADAAAALAARTTAQEKLRAAKAEHTAAVSALADMAAKPPPQLKPEPLAPLLPWGLHVPSFSAGKLSHASATAAQHETTEKVAVLAAAQLQGLDTTEGGAVSEVRQQQDDLDSALVPVNPALEQDSSLPVAE
jgi:hypothetical protein